MSLLDDVLHFHLGKALHWIPGEQGVESFANKFAHDLIQSVEQAPGGLVYLGKTAATHPERLPGIGVEMARQTLTDLEHPLRRPGYTALDLLGIVGGAGAIAGRAGAISGIVSRGGALPEALQGLDYGTVQKQLGRGAEYDRIVNKHTGEPIPVAKQIRDVLLHGPAPEERLLRVPGTTPSDLVYEPVHGWMYSKNPAIKAAQKLVDQAYDTHLDHNVPPIWRVARLATPFWRTQSGRISSARKAEELIVRKENKRKAAIYRAKYEGEPVSWHRAVELIATGTTPDVALARHQEILSSGALDGKPKLLNETRNRMAAIEDAKQYLTEQTHIDPVTGTERTVPVLKEDAPEKLHQYVADSRDISNERTTASRFTGVLDPESEIRRLVGPYIVNHGGVIPEALTRLRRQLGQAESNKNWNPAKAKEIRDKIDRLEGTHQLTLEDLLSGEHYAEDTNLFKDLIGKEQGTTGEAERFAKAADLFRVPYTFDRSDFLGKVFPDRAYRKAYKGGRVQVPSTYTHPFTGAILKGGGGDPNVAKLLAESYTEAHRFLALRSMRNKLLLASFATPEHIPEQYRALIRTDEVLPSGNITQAQAERLAQTRRPLDSLLDQEKITPEEAVGGGRLYEGLRREVFPKQEEVAKILHSTGMFTHRMIDSMLGRSPAEFQPVPGYRWIDKRMLGGLDKRNPLFGVYDNAIATKFIRGVDTVNALLKNVMLYLRPAYAAPNMLGNLALSLIHGGLLTPYHMAASLKTWRGLSKEERKAILEQMGEGTSAIAFERGNRVAATGAALGRFYSRAVDQPFRINAFLTEARRSGFGTAKEVRSLLTDTENVDSLARITNVANDAIINYERMGPGEEAVLRRLVLFYPFMKGATRYANYFYKNHPVAAGLSGGLGTLGEEQSQEVLGALPQYMAGLIPYTGGAFPLTGNPQSFGILTEPADLAKQVMNLGQENPNPNLRLTNNLSWAEGAILSALTGGAISTIPHQVGEPPLGSAWNQLVGGLPPLTLINRLRGKAGGGGPLDMSVYPDPSRLDALLTFFLLGGLAPRLTDRDLANWRQYQETHPH